MSKYDELWKYIIEQANQSIKLSFDEIKEIIHIEIDHSFLNFKKELNQYGYSVGKISLKNKTIDFYKNS
jgi:hypothetical protein